MEASMFTFKTQRFGSSLSMPRPHYPSLAPSHPTQIQIHRILPENPKLIKGHGWGLECAKAKGGSVWEVEKELEKEINLVEEEENLMGLGDKCRGEKKGIVEVMECLETEAIMGEDEGREAVDYNRRAQIFDKSGRVFQALKESKTTPTNS